MKSIFLQGLVIILWCAACIALKEWFFPDAHVSRWGVPRPAQSPIQPTKSTPIDWERIHRKKPIKPGEMSEAQLEAARKAAENMPRLEEPEKSSVSSETKESPPSNTPTPPSR